MTLESSKNLGGVGAILLFIGVLPWIAPYGWILSLIGLLLVMLGFKGLADYYQEAGVFNNALYAVILTIVGVVIFAILLFTAAVGFLSALGLSLANVADWSAVITEWSTGATPDLTLIWDFVAQILLAGVALWICLIIAAVFLRKSLGVVSAKSGVGLFGITGLLILIGAVIPVIGLLLIWIGILLLAVAFFSVRPQQSQPAMSTAAPTQA
jgi:uncharacterized membrane protein